MAVDIFLNRSSDLLPQRTQSSEPVTVGVHLDSDGRLTFSGGTQGNAVIVADPPTLILAASDDPLVTHLFRVTFQVETSGWEFSEEGAVRLKIGNNDAGLQVLPDTPQEVAVIFYNGLHGKQKDLGSFELGLVKSSSAALVEGGIVPQTIWHDPTILWEPPQG
jgi:hypothetical protein